MNITYIPIDTNKHIFISIFCIAFQTKQSNDCSSVHPGYVQYAGGSWLL